MANRFVYLDPKKPENNASKWVQHAKLATTRPTEVHLCQWCTALTLVDQPKG